MAEQTIQLPQDATANKNLLRALSLIISGSTVLQQVISVAGEDGTIASIRRSALLTADDDSRDLLQGINDKLEIVIGLLEA